MTIPTNRSRPNLPYVSTQTLPNSNRYQALNKFPPKAEQLDADFNAAFDTLNDLATAINETAAGVFPGSNDPVNASKLATTDGHGSVSWTKVESSNIEENAIQSRHIQAQSITNNKIQAGAVGNAQIALNSVGNGHFQDGCISQQQLQDGCVVSRTIAMRAVGNAQIALNSIGNGHFQDGCISQQQLQGGCVVSRTVQDASIGKSKLSQDVQHELLPTGGLIPYAGVNLNSFNFDPPGFLTCNGRSVFRHAYPALFAVIGIQYNYGNIPEDQFCIPDLRGRAIFGLCGSPSGTGDTAGRITGATANALNLGGSGGAETHTLTIDQIPPHSHTHNFPAVMQAGVSGTSGVYNGTISASTSMSGGGQPHNNMPPFILMNYLIKT